MAPSYTIPSAFGDIETEPFMFLGQIVGWILHRHRSDVDGSAEDWDAAERELFDLLDSGGIDVQGYRAPDFPSVYESLPVGIWKTINRGKAGDPTFSPIDQSEGREDGASVVAGNDRWDGVRIPKELVLKHWPPQTSGRITVAPADLATTVQSNDPAALPGQSKEETIAAMREYLEHCNKLFLEDCATRIGQREWTTNGLFRERFPHAKPRWAADAYSQANLAPSFRSTPGRPRKS